MKIRARENDDVKIIRKRTVLNVTVNVLFELSIVLDKERFQKVLDDVAECELVDGEEERYVDYSWASRGMMVCYRDSRYRKRIRLLMCAPLIMGNACDADTLVHGMRNRINRYFGGRFDLDDFALSAVRMSRQIDVQSRQNVHDYMTVLRRVGRVKGFTPREVSPNEEMLYWEGNSNATDFMLRSGAPNHIAVPTWHRHDASFLFDSETESVITAQVLLKKAQAVRKHAHGCTTEEQVAVLFRDRERVFGDVFVQIVPFGDFLKMNAAVERVRSEVANPALRRRMLHLLELVPEKKSLLLAQKSLLCRDIPSLMISFAEIELSPVTISKRQKSSALENIYRHGCL